MFGDYVTQSCAQCSAGAAQCQSLDESTECVKGYELIFDTCVACTELSDGCLACENQMCIECKTGLFSNDEGECVANCGTGKFGSPTDLTC